MQLDFFALLFSSDVLLVAVHYAVKIPRVILIAPRDLKGAKHDESVNGLRCAIDKR